MADYAIPGNFRKILYKLGVLKETSMLGCALVQKEEYIEQSILKYWSIFSFFPWLILRRETQESRLTGDLICLVIIYY